MDKATVLKVVKLARIGIHEDKVEHYVRELSGIMDVIEELKGADTTGLEPLVNVNEFALPLREDAVTDGNCVEKVLYRSYLKNPTFEICERNKLHQKIVRLI